MKFSNYNEIFLQNNGFDFVLFLVTSFYFTLRNIKITFLESRYSSLKVDINEIFITLLIAIQFLLISRSYILQIRILCRM